MFGLRGGDKKIEPGAKQAINWVHLDTIRPLVFLSISLLSYLCIQPKEGIAIKCTLRINDNHLWHVSIPNRKVNYLYIIICYISDLFISPTSGKKISNCAHHVTMISADPLYNYLSSFVSKSWIRYRIAFCKTTMSDHSMFMIDGMHIHSRSLSSSKSFLFKAWINVDIKTFQRVTIIKSLGMLVWMNEDTWIMNFFINIYPITQATVQNQWMGKQTATPSSNWRKKESGKHPSVQANQKASSDILYISCNSYYVCSYFQFLGTQLVGIWLVSNMVKIDFELRAKQAVN